MRKKFKAFCLISLFCLLIPVQALGSRPVDTIIVGCVIDGMLFDVGDSLPVKKVYMITVVPALNLTPYEGKKIRVQGKLTPGDRFQPDLDKGIEVLGACEQETQAVIRKELPQAYRTRAEEMAENDDWSNAWKYINKAIKLDSSDCSLYLNPTTSNDYLFAFFSLYARDRRGGFAVESIPPATGLSQYHKPVMGEQPPTRF